MKFRYLPRFVEHKAATWKSYLILSQDPIPPVRNCHQRAVAKEIDSSAAEMNQSRIEETHALQELVLANPVCFVTDCSYGGRRSTQKPWTTPQWAKNLQRYQRYAVAVWWMFSGPVRRSAPPLTVPLPSPPLPPRPSRPPPSVHPTTAQQDEGLPRKKRTKTYQCRCWSKVGEECTKFFETHTARVAHEVHARWLGGTHGLKLCVMTMTISNACPMCETFF